MGPAHLFRSHCLCGLWSTGHEDMWYVALEAAVFESAELGNGKMQNSMLVSVCVCVC